MSLPRAIGRVSRRQPLRRPSRVLSPRHFHPTSPAFFDKDDAPDDWVRRMREAKKKKDQQDRKRKAQEALDAARREEAARRLEEAERQRIWREAIGAIADRRIAPVVARYTELAAVIRDGRPEVAEWARRFKALKGQRQDAIRAVRSTVADIRCAVLVECQWLDQECQRLDEAPEMLKIEFGHIMDEIRAATIAEQLARVQRAGARKTSADWKQMSHGYMTFVWSTSAALTAAIYEFDKGLKQSERHLTRLEQSSSIIEHALSLHYPPTVRQRLTLLDDQYGHLIPDVDRLIYQPRRQMQISWEAESERFVNVGLELSKLSHDLNQIVEKSRYLGFNTTEGSLRLHTVNIFQTLTGEAVDTHELITDLSRSWVKRLNNSAFQMQKAKARAVVDAYRTCENLSACMKHLFIYMRPDFNSLAHRYKLIRDLETDDLCRVRVDRIMSVFEEASKHVTTSNQVFHEYESFSREQGYRFAPSHLAGSRRHLMAAIQAYTTNWRSIRFLGIDDLRDVVSRRSEEFAKSGELEDIRRHLVQFTEARLRRLWESPSYFEINPSALIPPHVLRSFMETWPEKHLDAGIDLLPGIIEKISQSMKGASPGRKVQLSRNLGLYKKILWWAKESASNPTGEKVPSWLEKVSQETPQLYILDKSAAKKKARVSGSRDVYFSYDLYRPASGLKSNMFPARPTRFYHEDAALDADTIKALRGKYIGFDMRWNQNAAPQDGPHANASLLMLARQSTMDIFHLARYPTRNGRAAIAEEMVTILESPTVIKVCVDAREKCNRLRDYLGVNPRGFLDLEDVHYGLQELQLGRPVPRRPLSLNDLTAEHLKCLMPEGVFDNTLDFTQPLLETARRSVGESVYACIALWQVMNTRGRARRLADRMMSTRPLKEDLTRTTSSIDSKDTGNDHPGNAAQSFSQEELSRGAEDTRTAERNDKEEEAGPAERDVASSSSSRIRSKVRRTAPTATGTRGDFWAQQKPTSRPHQRRDVRKTPDAQGVGDDGSISNPVAEAASHKPSSSSSSSSSSPALAPASPDAIAAAQAWADDWIATKPSTAIPDNGGDLPERRRLRLMLFRLWHHGKLTPAELTRAVDGATTAEMVQEDILSAIQWEERLPINSTKVARLFVWVPLSRRVERFWRLARRLGLMNRGEVAFRSVGLRDGREVASQSVGFEKGDEGGAGASDKTVATRVVGRKVFARTAAVEGRKERGGVNDKRERMTAAEFIRYMSKREQGNHG